MHALSEAEPCDHCTKALGSGRDPAVVESDVERFLKSAFDHAPIGMSVVDGEGNWLRVNDAYCALLGYQRSELLGKTFRDFTHPADVGQDVAWLEDARSGRSDGTSREKRYIARDGSTIWLHLRTEVVREQCGHIAYCVALLEDITERRMAQRALATSERLLRSIVDNAPNAIAVQRPDGAYTMVNPPFERRFGTLGEPLEANDRSRRTSSNARGALDSAAHQTVLRTGQSVEREETIATIDGDRIYSTVKYPLRDDEDGVYAVCTIFNDVTERRHREAELSDRLQWTERLHSAAAHDLFVLHGQPILNLRTNDVDQAELLVRLIDRRSSSGLLAPAEFLPAAERLGIADVVDRWVVSRAVQLAKQHHVEVNLSAQTICDANQVSALESLVVDSGAPPENIIFEITETTVAQNIEMARTFAERMCDLGCSFALDDFGTGFGTFTYLKHLPVDYLKIDIEFVRELRSSESDRQVVRAIVGVAQEYGMKTVAEGVEDQATLELLETLSVDYAQGYWIGRPIPLDELWPRPPEGNTS